MGTNSDHKRYGLTLVRFSLTYSFYYLYSEKINIELPLLPSLPMLLELGGKTVIFPWSCFLPTFHLKSIHSFTHSSQLHSLSAHAWLFLAPENIMLLRRYPITPCLLVSGDVDVPAPSFSIPSCALTFSSIHLHPHIHVIDISLCPLVGKS